jgi:glycosyltransferase involved in cell wall biosynthesis
MHNRSKPLSVAFLTKWDPLDPHSWSGTMKSMYDSLERRGVRLTALGPVRSGVRITLRCGGILTRAVLRRSYDHRHSFLAALEYAFRFQRKLAAGDFDVIFAPVASCEISLLKTELPIVYLTDIIFPDYKDSYQQYWGQGSRLLKLSTWEIERMEHLVMHKARSVICSSEWARRCAADTYALPSEQIHVLPFGPNLDRIPSYQEATRKRDLTVCRLLFLAVGWDRKGGPVAVEALKLLLEAGIPAELTVCGCIPPAGVSHPKLRVIPFLSKRDPAQVERLAHLLKTSTFLVLPTLAEAYGIVFCEASAFGLPSIARNTGGVGGVIEDGVNGYKVDSRAGAEAYARIILDLYRDPDRYHSLCVSARKTYERRLNWDAWAEGTQRVLEGVANRRQSEGSFRGG